jgi:hypothetical protein
MNKLEQLKKLNFDIDIAYYYSDQIECDELLEALQDSIYEQEIIYYSNAIDYLAKNDPSLNKSLELAADMGYELKNLNSEILATLLYHQDLSEQLCEIASEIESIFDEFDQMEDETE